MKNIFQNHNMINQYNGFYTSYNSYDRAMYNGYATTALCTDDMCTFLILNGNHIENYRKIASSWKDCVDYFFRKRNDWARYSTDGNTLLSKLSEKELETLHKDLLEKVA